ncbi:MAG: ABC transporter substrate-binding protein [Pseudomonadota bacterium]
MKGVYLVRVFLVCFVTSVILNSHGNVARGQEPRGVTDNLLKIGVILDLTGPTSNAGVVMLKAYKNLTAHVNAEERIRGRKIKLVVEDFHYSIPGAIASFKKLLFKDQVIAIMGPVSVGAAKVLFHRIEKNKIPTLAWAPDKSIMDPYKRYVFPTNGFYDNELGILLDYIMNELRPKNPKIAFATVDVESGKVVKASAEEWCKSYGLKVHHETIPLSAIDVASQVLSMKRTGATHILMHHVAPGAAAVLKDMKKFGLDIPLFGTSASCTEDIMRIAGEPSRNYIGISPYSSWYEEYPGMERVRKISMKYNPEAEKSYGIKSYILGWIMPQILCEGLRKAPQDLDGEKLVIALETIKDFDTQGLCGPITYTSKMHYGLNYSKLFKADPASGKFIPITDWRLPPAKK